MKARIRKTGEVVDVISFEGDIEKRGPYDWVSYIDSEGKEHSVEKGMNYYWDFERIPEVNTDFIQIDWEHRRYEIARQMLPTTSQFTQLSCNGYTHRRVSCPEAVQIAVEYADYLISKLKTKEDKQ